MFGQIVPALNGRKVGVHYMIVCMSQLRGGGFAVQEWAVRPGGSDLLTFTLKSEEASILALSWYD